MNWKLNAAFAACLMVTGAQAHFRFTLGYGDAAFAALNNSTVGGQMTDGATIKVPLRGQSFRVQLWAEKIALQNTGIHEDFYLAMSTIVAYDALPTPNAYTSWDLTTAFLHRKVAAKTSTAAGSIVNLATGLDGYEGGFSYTSDGPGSLFALSRRFRGVYTGDSQTPRLAGLSGQFGVSTATSSAGRYARLPLGTRLRLHDIDLTSHMDAGQTYGFAQGEAGLQAFVYSGTTGNPTGGSSSYFLSAGGRGPTRNEIGMRVNLQAVPEPGSLGALALGALMLLRRRCA